MTEQAALPVEVRKRVLELAAEHLGRMAEADVPAALKRVRSFVPSRRAGAGGAALARALEADPVFRSAVAEAVRTAQPELAQALVDGELLPAVPPAEAAAVAYLLRVDAWSGWAAAAAEESARLAAASAESQAQVAERRLREQLEATRRSAREEAERLRTELTQVRAELEATRKKVRSGDDRVRRALASAEQRTADLIAERDQVAVRLAESELAASAAAGRAAAAETELREMRADARAGRSADEARLRVLLDAQAATLSGLREELGLRGSPADRPAEHAPLGNTARARSTSRQSSAGGRPDPFAGVPSRGAGPDDPGLLARLLEVPMAHLLVDGYNVAKNFGGGLPEQRSRLLAGLSGWAASRRVEITVVFDAQHQDSKVVMAPVRGVRVRFSPPDVLADDVLRSLVRAEPAGRPLVVVTSDRAVADDVRALGARVAASAALVGLLSGA